MKRAYTCPPDNNRCRADIILRDGSGARCMRASRINGLCRQHAKLAIKRNK